MKHLILALALLALSFPSHAQDAQDTKITNIRDNLHFLVSPSGGNITVSTGIDGTFIIDDQLEDRGEIIEQAIKTISDESIKFVLNTHYHFDHTGGNEHFGAQDALIVAHDNVYERLSTDQFITHFKRDMPALKKEGLPVVTFDNTMTLHYNGDDIKIIHTPNAHTDGDAAAHFTNENVIVAGDTIFNNMYPFIDTEHGGNVKGVIKALDIYSALADDNTIIVPGHGPLMNKAELQTYRDALATMTASVETAISEGKTLEQIIAAKPTKDFDETMGKGMIPPDVFVTFLYESLGR